MYFLIPIMAFWKRQNKDQWLPGAEVGDRKKAEADFRGSGSTVWYHDGYTSFIIHSSKHVE